MRKVDSLISQHQIDVSHFDGGKHRKIKWEKVNINCPVCGKEFITQPGHPREKKTCSYSCSNIFFRSGENNPNFKHGFSSWKKEYRQICFRHYPYKCALCPWDKIVEVHHIDGNNSNNDIDNLIPLCANHHRLTECKQYKKEIDKQILEFKKQNP